MLGDTILLTYGVVRGLGQTEPHWVCAIHRRTDGRSIFRNASG
jgi:hypothetical protein